MATTTITINPEIELEDLASRYEGYNHNLGYDRPGPGPNDDTKSSSITPIFDSEGIVEDGPAGAGSVVATMTETLVAPSRTRSAAIMLTLSCISLLNTFNTGALTATLPVIAKDINLPSNLLLWPASVYALALSCTLLLMGAIADMVGNRPIFLLGTFLFTGWTIAVALAQTASQLIVFRAMQGIAMSFCMPAAISTITNTFPSGKTRNLAFAIFGGGSPLGFALGLVLGGILGQVSSWRTAYYMAGGINAVVFVIAYFNLPASGATLAGTELRQKLLHEFDWVGVASASISLALLSYIFAEITYSGSVMDKPLNIVLLVIAVLLVPFFIWWESYQERRGHPAILPNSIWLRREFSAVCITVFLVWCWFNAYGYWCTLFFQEIQQLDTLQAALRFLPLVAVGIGTNVVASMVMDKISAGWLAILGGLLSAAAPLLFALQDPSWSYWKAGFPAMILSVVSTDLLFNISNLVITTNFPSKSQALAGSVFSTVSQLGNSIGLAVTAIIQASVTDSTSGSGRGTHFSYDYSTLEGYRAAFWTCFAAAIISTGISAFGLRKAGKVGLKKDL